MALHRIIYIVMPCNMAKNEHDKNACDLAIGAAWFADMRGCSRDDEQDIGNAESIAWKQHGGWLLILPVLR